jgi:hypothetical protein
MPKVYRSMARDGDVPRTGSNARSLGVRVPTDISPPNDGLVSPGMGGMSVSPSWRELPIYRIPRRLNHLVPGAAGNDADACWTMGTGIFENGPLTKGLNLRPDKPGHGLVEPDAVMSLAEFQDRLAGTRCKWRIEED